jgi:hypothetical protein
MNIRMGSIDRTMALDISQTPSESDTYSGIIGNIELASQLKFILGLALPTGSNKSRLAIGRCHVVSQRPPTGNVCMRDPAVVTRKIVRDVDCL